MSNLKKLLSYVVVFVMLSMVFTDLTFAVIEDSEGVEVTEQTEKEESANDSVEENIEIEGDKETQLKKEDSDEKKIEQETNANIDFLYHFGILYENFDIKAKLTRGDAGILISNIIRLNADTPAYFKDVPKNHKAFKQINMLAQLGIVSMNDDAVFNPDNEITYSEFVTMLVKAAGYDYEAKSMGGYPIGYMAVAQRLNIFGRNINMNGTVTGQSAAAIIRNILDVNVAEQSVYGVDIRYGVSKTETVASKYLKIRRHEGIVTANSITALFGKSDLRSDWVELKTDDGNIIFQMGHTNAQLLLGYSVIAYSHITSDSSNVDTLAYIYKNDKRNREITIHSSDIINATVSEIEFNKEGTSSRSQKISLVSSTSFIYNGQYYFEISDEELKVRNGELTLIDNNSDGTYDVVFVYEYKNFVVATVSLPLDTVVDKYTGESLQLDRTSSEYLVDLKMDNVSVNLDTLKEWDVLAVAISKNITDKYVISVEVSREEYTGVVDEVLSGEDNKKLKVDGQEFRVNPYFAEIFDVKPGDYGTFYFDKYGGVAGFNRASTGGRNYAYVVGMEQVNGILGVVKIDIIDNTGVNKVLELEDKISYNDERIKAEKLIKNIDFMQTDAQGSVLTDGRKTFFNHQLILYELNTDGKVRTLYTSQIPREPDEIRSDSLVLNSHNATAVYRANFSTFGGDGIVTPETLTYRVEVAGNADVQGVTEITDKNRIKIVPYKTLEDGIPYNTYMYDCDINKFAGAVVVKTNKVSSTRADSMFSRNMFVFNRKAKTIIDDEEKVKVHGYHSGNAVSFVLQDETLADDWEFGDILQLWQNADGEIIDYEKAFSFNLDALPNPTGKKKPILNPTKPGNTVWNGSTSDANDPLGALSLYLGNVSSKYDKTPYLINVKLPFDASKTMDDPPVVSRPFMLDSNTKITKITKYNEKIVSAGRDDIMVNTTPDNLVFLNIRYGAVRDVIIIEII